MNDLTTKKEKKHYVKGMLQRVLSLLLCITIILTGILIQADAAGKKFIKAEPTVFVPSTGEKAKITFNLEKDRVMNVMIMQGDKVIDYLAKDVIFEGKYKPHELTWDGRDTTILNDNNLTDLYTNDGELVNSNFLY